MDLNLAAGDDRLLAAVSQPGDGTECHKAFWLVIALVERLLRKSAAGAAEQQVQHPVSGWFATRLAWTFTPPGAPAMSGFPDPGGRIVHTPGGPWQVPPGTLVRLLHPMLAGPGEVDQLRQLASRRGIIQPLRHRSRETHPLTGAERQDGLATAS